MSSAPIDLDYIHERGQGRSDGRELMAIVVQRAARARLSVANAEHEMRDCCTRQARRGNQTSSSSSRPWAFAVGNYGMTKWSDLFTPRQLVALTTFC